MKHPGSEELESDGKLEVQRMRIQLGKTHFFNSFQRPAGGKKSLSQALLGNGYENRTLSTVKGAGIPAIFHVSELV